MDPLEEVLTSIEAAERLAVTKRQVARLCKAQKLKYREAPGGLLILKQSVEDYEKVQRSRSKPTTTK